MRQFDNHFQVVVKRVGYSGQAFVAYRPRHGIRDIFSVVSRHVPQARAESLEHASRVRFSFAGALTVSLAYPDCPTAASGTVPNSRRRRDLRTR